MFGTKDLILQMSRIFYCSNICNQCWELNKGKPENSLNQSISHHFQKNLKREYWDQRSSWLIATF